VHDAGGRLSTPDGKSTPPPEEHPFLRLTRTLEPGFVVTIEPGLYFIPSLLEPLRNGPPAKLVDWDNVDSLTPYGGIRIEDNVLVTDTENRNLSRPALLQSGIS
jgi:Xaa-Pro dipeptidase